VGRDCSAGEGEADIATPGLIVSYTLVQDAFVQRKHWRCFER
jgi:hypothetical protein